MHNIYKVLEINNVHYMLLNNVNCKKLICINISLYYHKLLKLKRIPFLIKNNGNENGIDWKTNRN